MILVDTSVWIGLLRGSDPPAGAVDRLEDLVTCGPIIQEIFQGLDDGVVSTVVRDSMLALPRIENPLALEVFLEAADIYRYGRAKGYTIRSTLDCLIAAIAIRNGAAIWHRDRDFTAIARYTTLKTTDGYLN